MLTEMYNIMNKPEQQIISQKLTAKIIQITHKSLVPEDRPYEDKTDTIIKNPIAALNTTILKEMKFPQQNSKNGVLICTILQEHNKLPSGSFLYIQDSIQFTYF